MKNYLRFQFNQMILKSKVSMVCKKFVCKFHERSFTGIHSKGKSSFVFVLFLVLIFLFSFSAITAQRVENLEDYINANPLEAQQLENLVVGSLTTLFIYEREFLLKGETNPVIADVVPSSFAELYFTHSEFESIELLRIKVKNVDDLNYILDFDKLNNFKNLKYVYVIITLEICPENVGDIACQKSKISNMFSVSGGVTSPVVLLEIANLM
jgi:hypothetical protein